MNRIFFLFASFLTFSGVALGAFGAHGLKNIVTPDLLVIFETAVRYQMYHAFGLFVVAIVYPHSVHNNRLRIAGWLFIAGTILFSGSLYAMVFTGMRWLGAATPVGGVVFLLGWIFLFLSAFKTTTEN